MNTPHEIAKQRAQAAAIADVDNGCICDSSRYSALPGSAWDDWYTMQYLDRLKEYNDKAT